jgi:hypothetical protein
MTNKASGKKELHGVLVGQSQYTEEMVVKLTGAENHVSWCNVQHKHKAANQTHCRKEKTRYEQSWPSYEENHLLVYTYIY